MKNAKTIRNIHLFAGICFMLNMALFRPHLGWSAVLMNAGLSISSFVSAYKFHCKGVIK